MKLGTKLFIVIVVLGAAGIVPLISHWATSPQETSETGVSAGHRTVIVIAPQAPITSALVRDRLCGAFSHCQNGRDATDVVVLLQGIIPKRPVRAIVETDENCTPDTYGISHCTNALQLPDGRILLVRHDHNMQAYPCLKPGETVTVEGEPSI